MDLFTPEINRVATKMAPTWMLDLMERGERIQVVAHEPPYVKVMRQTTTFWSRVRNRFLYLLV